MVGKETTAMPRQQKQPDYNGFALHSSPKINNIADVFRSAALII